MVETLGPLMHPEGNPLDSQTHIQSVGLIQLLVSIQRLHYWKVSL